MTIDLPLDALDAYDTVWLEEPAGEAPRVMAIDQTLLPGQLVIEALTCKEDVWRAIKRLEVRGAPAIGVCAALGAYVDAWRLAYGEDAEKNGAADVAAFLGEFERDCAYLEASRPTAVNLAWALRRMVSVARAAARVRSRAGGAGSAGRIASGEPVDASAGTIGASAGADGGLACTIGASAGVAGGVTCTINASVDTVGASAGVADTARAINANPTIPDVLDVLRAEALAIHSEDVRVCRSIGEHGAELLRHDLPEKANGILGILTHCNAGRLATVRYGTATAPLYVGREQGMRFKAFCDETRPLLQGARLTAFELQSAGFDTTVLCDNMSASLMATGAVDAVFVGCDRVAANGDTANKIGTSMVALAAARHGIPFYVCAPTSTIDLSTPDGDHIPIEQRDATEVTDRWYERRMAPKGVGVYNPAFDVTAHDLITAIVTEHGVVRPPFDEGLRRVCDR